MTDESNRNYPSGRRGTMIHPFLFILVNLLATSTSFIYPSSLNHRRSITSLSSESASSSPSFPKINFPNPFSGTTSTDPSNLDVELEQPNTLFDRARAVIAADFKDPFLLDEDFIWISPELYGRGLNKDDYVAACNFFNLRGTFPDLDYRAHDFRLDPNDPFTVRLTMRVVGTMRGDLRLRKEVLPANGQRMVCPPEAVTMTFAADTFKLKKLTSGFTMDRRVGNTDGTCGIPAAATVAGSPPSIWERIPATVVIQRFFARTTLPLEEPTSFLAPFPESVMVQLAKGVLAADNGASDPELLSEGFEFWGPLVGPIGKEEFVKAFGGFKLKEAFPDLETSYTNFRVDPFDPYRVWLDARGSGTDTGGLIGKPPTGQRYEGPAEAVSITFDDEGLCTRLTAGAVIDPSQGNTGGLGGVFGILYAIGNPLPGIAARPLPEIFSRLQKRILQPVTGIDVDDYGLPKSRGTAPIPSAAIEKVAETPKSPVPTEDKSSPSGIAVSIPKIDLPKIEVPKIELPTPPQKPIPPPKPPALESNIKEQALKKSQQEAARQAATAERKRKDEDNKRQKEAEERQRKQALEKKEKETAAAAAKQQKIQQQAARSRDDLAARKKAEAEERKQTQLEKKEQAAKAAQEKKEKAAAAAQARKEAAARAAKERRDAAEAATRERKEVAARAAKEKKEKAAAAAQARKDAASAQKAQMEKKKLAASKTTPPVADSKGGGSGSPFDIFGRSSGPNAAADAARKKKEQAEAVVLQKKQEVERRKSELKKKKDAAAVATVSSSNPVGDFISRSPTFKLFFASDKDDKAPASSPPVATAKRPKGVPLMAKW
eukprot:CAMPEP_0172500554 /NCGR_PEP_ID=MMETSP1066-20121228/139999_1 /TAXON_ID=671091 /ORGANISM="Coscinodiscus wailesii, Strain CCMP2513" /LENGTH=829 /DNA_ID=CAMNT_0013274845 /DNA_START=125 /DNA_END=2611 /DNA_ORIENTATION=-